MQYRLLTFLCAAALCGLPATGMGAPLKLIKTADTVVDATALYLPDGQWGNSVNGQSFQQDAVTSFKGYQYATHYDSSRRLCVARRKLNATAWEVIRFEDYKFKSNDTHNVAVLGVCELDGTIHLSFDHHGHPLHYRVSKKHVATTPEKFPWTADLFGAITSDLEPGKPLNRVTYPRFLRTPEGGLQFGCRIGGSGNGDKCLADYDWRTGTWKNFGPYISGKGTYAESNSRNAYLNGLTYDRRGRLHVTWCWRETGDPMTNHDVCYAWSDDRGLRWFNSAGNLIGTRGSNPVSLDSPGVRVAEIPMNRGLINATTQAVDRKNQIHAVTFHLPDGTPRQPDWLATRQFTRFFHYWRDTKGAWHRNEMPFIGGRPQLWFDEKDNAFMVFTGSRYNPDPKLSIAAATAKSRWNDWKIIHEEAGSFTGQPQLDRYRKPGTLSVYIEEEPANLRSEASRLRVLEFRAK